MQTSVQTPFSNGAETVAVLVHEEATSWFDADRHPAHTGVYQRQYPAGPYSFWDGLRWHADALTPDEAASLASFSSCQKALWRGLAQHIGSSDFHPAKQPFGPTE